MGDMDLVRPLGVAGIPCAVIGRRQCPPRYSRFTYSALDWTYTHQTPEQLVDALIRFGSAQPATPILFYEHDEHVLLISRYRERLRQAFRFVVPTPELVENLADKSRFQVLAERLRLPVPRSWRLSPSELFPAQRLDLRFPIMLKPLTRRDRDDGWVPLGGTAKAVRIDDVKALRELWPRLAASGMQFVAQELISGPETRVESYHVYVDEADTIVAEFTGRKIRTSPVEYGHSTALMITDAADVRQLGRALVHKLKLRGVAKFDFKRASDGTLYLLEVNPRFTLWSHLGAVAGVNIPALVYSDLAGLPRTVVPQARAGVQWCVPWQDVKAAKALGVPLIGWLSWLMRCDATADFAWDDPMPFIRGKLWPKFAHGLRSRIA